MKRISLATLLLLAGGAGLIGVSRQASTAQRQLQSNRAEWLVQTQHLAVIESDFQTLTRQVQEAKQELRRHEATALAETALFRLYEDHDLKAFSPQQVEQLFAELGLNWSASDEYLVISKTTLGKLGVNSLKNDQLTDVACSVLAITPEERRLVDAAFLSARATFADWGRANAQREGPSNDMLVRYTIPENPALTREINQRLAAELETVLGRERANMLTDYSRSWRVNLGLHDAGVSGSPTTVTLGHPSGDGRIGYEYKRGGSTMSSEVSPWQPFPEALSTLFPGGWEELAQREGFELPKEFQKVRKP